MLYSFLGWAGCDSLNSALVSGSLSFDYLYTEIDGADPNLLTPQHCFESCINHAMAATFETVGFPISVAGLTVSTNKKVGYLKLIKGMNYP